MAKKQEEIKPEEIKQLEERVNDLDAQLKRAVADYHNLEKRISEGRSELTNWATTELISKLLPVLDHLEKVVDGGRSILSEQSESKDWFKGVEMAVKELKQVLQAEGLEEIMAGVDFNPALHEAVDTREGENGKILEVVQKGFTLNGKIVRPARVVVGKKDVTLGNKVTPESDDSGQARITEEENK